MVDNVIKAVPAAKVLMDENARSTGGGTRIYAPLLYGYNQTTTWFNQADYIDASPQEAVTAAQYKWANLAAAITIFGEEEMQNSGEAKLEDFAEAKIKQAELSLARQINQAAYGDGTTFFGAAPDGLLNLIFQTTTGTDPAGGAVGGISAATFPFWRNNATLAAGAFASFGPMGSSSPDKMLQMYHLCSDGGIRTRVILSDQSTIESYHINAKNEYRTMDNSLLDLGFDGVTYKGVPWLWDRDCPTGTQYFIEEESSGATEVWN